MATVAEVYARRTGPVVACDFSPPRSADLAFLRDARQLSADLLCVAYGPGRSVRLGSVAAGALIKREVGTEVICNLATRDMNKLALQMHLLEAQALGVENILVLRGDPFAERDLRLLKAVDDFSPTELVRAMQDMNRGKDFRGASLAAPTALCPGAVIDLARPLEAEAALAARKVEAGAEYLISQGVYSAAQVRVFRRLLAGSLSGRTPPPVFFGVAVLVKGGVLFSDAPVWVQAALDGGRSGQDIALQVIQELQEEGCDAFYIVPPIQRGGTRDYEAAQAVIAQLKERAR
jgi:5,10-methylenetetrahydrofolate reductase